ncbi:hypothetical protein [Arthrobacter ramosus]|uniref:hypothetical protein n=1 Tax=Arthrobacter ramosus TaxID=1672 RepID=UPI001F19505E|nr:hypothetical protein [Arthrobacter ramosus]
MQPAAQALLSHGGGTGEPGDVILSTLRRRMRSTSRASLSRSAAIFMARSDSESQPEWLTSMSA